MSTFRCLFRFALILAVSSFGRAADCSCANPGDRVKIGFKQVAHFAGRITTKFYFGGEEIPGTQRSYTAGSISTQTFGCGEFSDTVFITATIGQEITILTSFDDDPASADYTEIDPSNSTILTVVSLPSASCLNHFTKLMDLEEWARVIPGVELNTPPTFANSSVTKFVTYSSAVNDPADAGSGSGPGFGTLTTPPERSDFMDANPLGVLCGSQSASTVTITAAAAQPTSGTNQPARAAATARKSQTSNGLVTRTSSLSKSKRKVVDPFTVNATNSAPQSFWKKQSNGRAPTGRGRQVKTATLPVPNLLLAKPGSGATMRKPATDSGSSDRQRAAAAVTSEDATPMTAAAPPVPGSVVQAGVGAINLPIALGYQQGKLFYVSQGIDASSYSPAKLHLSADAKSVHVVKDGSANLRQASLPGLFLDIRTLSASACEVRFYNPNQVGAFGGTIYPISDDSPFCVWRIENPDATNLGRIRFVQTRDGQSTTHLASWQPAGVDNAGVMTIAYNNEAEIETRTYFLYTNPYARGERIQRRAGPLDNPGPIVADSFDAYQEFYNWSATGQIYEALIEHTDDPAGAALMTQYVYYDAVGLAAKSLNGIIYPDGYWERYGRFEDGSMSKRYRPHLDGPASPGLATDANSLITNVTFPDTGSTTMQVEVQEDIIFNAALVRHDEIVRQIVNDNYVETTLNFLDGGSYTQGQTIGTGRNGLLLASYDANGTSRRYNYEPGFWDASTQTFTLVGAGIRARRATELQGSLTHPFGVANQTLIIVTIRDDNDRVLLEETFVNDGNTFFPGMRTDWISRTVRTYDGRGFCIAEARNGRIVFEAGYDAEGRVSFQVDEIGIRTEYTYDKFGRLSQTVRKRGAASPDQTTTFSYDAAGRLRFQTIAAGVLTSTTEYRYDVAGRRTYVVTPEGLVETTSELFYVDTNGQPAHREVTATSPSGATTILEYYRDRSLFYKHGTAVPTEYWGYSYSSPAGFKLQYFYRQISDPNSILFQALNWRGDMMQDSQLNFGGTAAFNRIYTYGGGAGADSSIRGLLASANTTGQAPALLEYDEFGRRSAEGVDTNANGVIDRASSEPLTTHSELFELSSSPAVWSHLVRDYRHLADGVDAPTLQTESRDILTGLGIGVLADRSILDASGRQSRETITLDRATLTRTTVVRDLAADGASQPESRMEIGGLVRTLRRPEATANVNYTYDGLDRLKEVNDPTSGISTYNYNPHGQLDAVTDNLNRVTSFTYHPTGVAGAGYTATRLDAAGQTTRYSYTIRNQLFRQWGGGVYPTEYTYDDQSRVTGLRTFRTIDVGQPNGTVDWNQATWPTSVTGDLTRWTYDYWSGLLASKIYADNRTILYNYDSSLRLWRRTNGRSQVTTYGYDALGRLTTLSYPAGSGSSNVIYGYDRASRLASVDDGTGARALTYSDFDQPQNETFSAGLLAGVTISRTFDPQNRPSGITASGGEALNYSATYGYDALSRFNTLNYGSAIGGALNFVYAYAAGTNRVETLTSSRAGTTIAVMSRTYDSLGRLTATVTRNGAGATLLSHGYTQFDSLDRRKKVLREDGKEWSYDYNVRGEVTAARKQFPVNEGNEWLAGWQATYVYDSIGNRVSAATGGDGAGVNLRVATYTTNQLNQYVQRTVPGSIFFTGEASSAATVEITVNEQPLSSVLRQGAPGAKSFFAAEYQTDNSNLGLFGISRIRASTSGNSPVGQLGSFYLSKSPEVFTYDLDGNLTRDEQWIYAWDVESRLIAMETRSDRLRPSGPLPLERRLKLDFAYDAQGRRIQKKVWTWNILTSAWVLSSDLRFVYDQWNCLAELSVQGETTTAQCSYTWGLDLSGSLYGVGGVGGLLAQSTIVMGASGDYLYSYDGNGNVAGLISVVEGTLAAEYDYSAFGEVLKSIGMMAEINRYRFSTKTQDETGMNYYGFRFYAPILGRWLSNEPLGEIMGGNLYNSTGNGLINKFDVLGLYQVDGHYYHLLSALILSSVPLEAAKELTFYSQLPDELTETTAFDTNRPVDTLRRIIAGDDALRDAGDWLHSLGLGDEKDILKRRKCLTELLQDNSLNNMQKGLVLHALGDAYSHTYEAYMVTGIDDIGSPILGSMYTRGYPHVLGHTQHFTWPDIISNRPERYVAFIKNVQMAFNPSQSPIALEPLTNRILNKKDSVHERAGGLYPEARALAQKISGDRLEYRPEIIDEHSLNNPVVLPHGEPYRIPSISDIRQIIEIMKCKCAP